MRSLWKGTTEFWTNDMTQDDTWEANRPETQLPCSLYFRIPLPQLNMSAEIPIVPHTENAEEEGVALGLPKFFSVCRTHHHDSSGATESQRQNPGEGMSSPVGQTPGEWHGKGIFMPAVWSHHQRQGRNHGNHKSIQRNLCPTRRSDIPARRWTDAQNWTWCKTRSTKPRGRWRRPIWKYKQPREAAFRMGQAMEKMSQVTTLFDANLEPAGQ